MTDMINGAFMEDLSELLNSATGDQRRRKSFYEIDTEFEKMTASLQKNFSSMASLMPFLRASLRQTMMRRLATVGKDKDGWKKADEYLARRYIGCQACTQRRPSGQEAYPSVHCVWQTGAQCR
jgi:hypothetical protein